MLSSVTGIAGGKKENTIEIMRKQIENKLIAKPAFPRVQGPQRISSERMRLWRMRMIGIKYEEKRPAMVRETMALNAADEAMLIRQIVAVRVAQKRTELRGSAMGLLTCEAKNELLELLGKKKGAYSGKEV